MRATVFLVVDPETRVAWGAAASEARAREDAAVAFGTSPDLPERYKGAHAALELVAWADRLTAARVVVEVTTELDLRVILASLLGGDLGVGGELLAELRVGGLVSGA